MNRLVVILGCCALIFGLAACGSDKKKSSDVPSTTTSIAPTPSTSAAAGSTTTASTVEFPTTSLPCQPLPIPPTPVKNPVASKSVLLTKVQNISDGCVDHVVFDYIGKGTIPPGYSITYGTPPFTNAGSGAPVAVPGKAFIVVTVKPGYGFDFETGKATYTGPKSIAVTGARHVQSIVETDDFEGVLTWVIGLNEKRAFSVQATGTPRLQLAVTVS